MFDFHNGIKSLIQQNLETFFFFWGGGYSEISPTNAQKKIMATN